MAEDPLGITIQDPDETGEVDLDTEEALQNAADEAGWPLELERRLQQLRQVKPDVVVNKARLGEDLAFTEAEQQLADIVQILSDLREEEWRFIRPDLAQAVVPNAQQTLDTLRNMAAFRLNEPNSQALRNQYAEQLRVNHTFFVNEVRPVCGVARVEEVLEKRRDLLSHGLSEERVVQLQETIAKLEADVKEFERLSPLVAAQREIVEEKGVSNLSAHFSKLVDDSRTSFEKWAWSLVAAVVVGGVSAVAWVYLTRPGDDAGNSEIVTHIALDVLVVGLVVFLIRFLAIQARAHRHVEFVARNKANALSTFNLIVSGPDDPAVRA